jgi:hypothetical protein
MQFSTATKYGNSIANPLNNSVSVPVVTYSNAAADKSRVLKENKGKSGVYL